MGVEEGLIRLTVNDSLKKSEQMFGFLLPFQNSLWNLRKDDETKFDCALKSFSKKVMVQSNVFELDLGTFF